MDRPKPYWTYGQTCRLVRCLDNPTNIVYCRMATSTVGTIRFASASQVCGLQDDTEEHGLEPLGQSLPTLQESFSRTSLLNGWKHCKQIIEFFKVEI